MTVKTSTYPILDSLWVAEGTSRTVRNVVLALLGTGLLALSAKAQVPMWPVPMTMQPLAVLLIGMAFGWKLGGITVGAYLLEGAAGLPVFAKGGGLAYLAGPTGGYLVGFLAAAVVVGWLAGRGWDRTPVRAFLTMLIGIATIYAFGVIWLAQLIGPAKAVSMGMLPFLFGDLVKALAATAIMPTAWRLLGRG